MSRAFVNNNNQFIVKENSLKKYPCKMSISLECNSPYYKSLKKERPVSPIRLPTE